MKIYTVTEENNHNENRYFNIKTLKSFIDKEKALLYMNQVAKNTFNKNYPKPSEDKFDPCKFLFTVLGDKIIYRIDEKDEGYEYIYRIEEQDIGIFDIFALPTYVVYMTEKTDFYKYNIIYDTYKQTEILKIFQNKEDAEDFIKKSKQKKVEELSEDKNIKENDNSISYTDKINNDTMEYTITTISYDIFESIVE